jgi:hypothetical protein
MIQPINANNDFIKAAICNIEVITDAVLWFLLFILIGSFGN